jgi:hypothetical protein
MVQFMPPTAFIHAVSSHWGNEAVMLGMIVLRLGSGIVGLVGMLGIDG